MQINEKRSNTVAMLMQVCRGNVPNVRVELFEAPVHAVIKKCCEALGDCWR